MLGDKLREARERKKLTIKDIEKGTSIRSLYIEALENGKYGQLPGEVYVKGFIRNYANFVGLDASAMVKEYLEENHSEQIAAEPQGTGGNVQETGAAPVQNTIAHSSSRPSEPEQEAYSYLRQRVDASHRRQNILLAGGIFVVVLIAAGYFLMSTPDEPQREMPQNPAQTTTTQPAEAQAKPDASQKRQDVEVVAEYTARCWTEVKADGKVIFEGTVESGKTMKWNAKEQIVITAGNAGAVTYTVNGKRVGAPGEKGQVVEKTFTKDNT